MIAQTTVRHIRLFFSPLALGLLVGLCLLPGPAASQDALAPQVPRIAGTWSSPFLATCGSAAYTERVAVEQYGAALEYYWARKLVGNPCVPKGALTFEGRLNWLLNASQKTGTTTNPASTWQACGALQVKTRDPAGMVTQFAVCGHTYTKVLP